MDLRIFLTIAGVLVSLLICLLGVLRLVEFKSLLIFAVIYGANGFVQSMGMPGATAVMGNWVSKDKRDLIIVIQFYQLKN